MREEKNAIIFTKCFLSALYLAGVEQFSIDNEYYNDGVKRIAKLFKDSEEGWIKFMFRNVVFCNGMHEFDKALNTHYGVWFSIIMPAGNRALINISSYMSARSIVDTHAPEIGMDIKIFRKVAEAFIDKKSADSAWE